MAITLRLAVVPRAVLIWLLIAILIAGAIAGAAVGSRLGLLAVSDEEPATVQNGLVAFDTPEGDIMVADPDGSDPRVLVGGDAEQYGPSWSPDGRWLAYFEKIQPGAVWDSRFHIHVVGADGRGDVDLTPDRDLLPTRFAREQPVAAGLEWSPDSRQLALSVVAPDPWTAAWDGTAESCGNLSDPVPSDEPHPRILVIDADGSGIHPLRIADECGHREPLPVPAWDPVWSPEGSQLAFKARGALTETELGIFVADIPEQLDEPLRPLRVTSRDLSPEEGYSFDSPSWSPDGKRITFYCCEGVQHDIWVVDADGTDEHVLSPDPFDEYWPTWSPDGSRIVYQRIATQPGNDTMIIGPDGRVPTRLEIPPSGGNGAIVWSPDGTKLLLITDGYDDFMIVDVDGAAEPVLITDTDRERPPVDLIGDWQPLPGGG